MTWQRVAEASQTNRSPERSRQLPDLSSLVSERVYQSPPSLQTATMACSNICTYLRGHMNATLGDIYLLPWPSFVGRTTDSRDCSHCQRCKVTNLKIWTQPGKQRKPLETAKPTDAAKERKASSSFPAAGSHLAKLVE